MPKRGKSTSGIDIRWRKDAQGTFDEVMEKYVEMNIAHPFREENGRSYYYEGYTAFKSEEL